VPRIDEAPRRLFGTDGVRGTAGRPPLDKTTIRRVGAALVRALPPKNDARLVIGRDTRESGSWIEAELAHGAKCEGATVVSLGVVPTPAVAYIARECEFDAGVVISASHNPFQDNGIKVFSGRGEKFSEAIERGIEAVVADEGWRTPEGDAPEVARADLMPVYLDHLRAVVSDCPAPAGFRLAIDCANGATAGVAPGLFRSLGYEVRVIGDQPTGRNINLQCGSTRPEALARIVVDEGCRMGVAFDGDGDRAILVDGRGQIVNGDAVLLFCARQLQREGRLKGGALVATVMSNIGLEIALRQTGIEVVRCAVGDKYVMEEMLSRGLSLGGEQSGHIIFSDYLFTGDGLCTALNVLRTVALSGRSLASLASDLVSYPQVLLNIAVRVKPELSTVPAIVAAIERVTERVNGQGRVLVRYSGTEPLLRVMIEGREQDEISAWAQEIGDVVRRELG
jgi:phosphoglucosamine mutase